MWRKTVLLVWWLAVIDPNGQILVMEWRDRGECEFYERLYKRIIGLKVTTCQEKQSQRSEAVG